MLVVNPSIPANNVKELIALLKTNPGKYSFSLSSCGATSKPDLFILLEENRSRTDTLVERVRACPKAGGDNNMLPGKPEARHEQSR